MKRVHVWDVENGGWSDCLLDCCPLCEQGSHAIAVADDWPKRHFNEPNPFSPAWVERVAAGVAALSVTGGAFALALIGSIAVTGQIHHGAMVAALLVMILVRTYRWLMSPETRKARGR